MKKRITAITLTIVGSVLLSGAVLAASAPIKFTFNGQEYAAEPFKLKLEKGTVMVSLRSIVEQLQGTVSLSNHTVNVQMPEVTNLSHQTKRLEDAWIADNAEDAARTWIKGVQTRNGALQYAVFSPQLRKETKKEFDDAYWVTGGSSPHMTKVDKLNAKELSPGTIQISFDYPLEASNWKGSGKAVLTVKKMETDRGEGWFITSMKLKDPGDTGLMIGAGQL